jgi:hypothetical protein
VTQLNLLDIKKNWANLGYNFCLAEDNNILILKK